MASLTLSTVDRNSKKSLMKLGIDAGATTIALQALVDATDAIILGSNLKAVKTDDTTVDAGVATPAASTSADRGNKWLFRVQDATNGKIFTHEIGTADNSQLPSAGSDYIDLTAGAGLTLKNSFEAVYESPYGNAGTLLSVQQVTRTD